MTDNAQNDSHDYRNTAPSETWRLTEYSLFLNKTNTLYVKQSESCEKYTHATGLAVKAFRVCSRLFSEQMTVLFGAHD